jgi:hypothetical protein
VRRTDVREQTDPEFDLYETNDGSLGPVRIPPRPLTDERK